MIEANFITFIRVLFLFKSEGLSANIKLSLHKIPIRSVITYACSTWEFAADSHLLKLSSLKNKVPRTIGKFPRRTYARESHMTSQMPYIYNCIMKLCRQQVEVIQNHESANARDVGKVEARHRK
jgi:hypothetical protein